MKQYHLTTPQQNIWNLQKYYEDTAIAGLCGAVFFQEKRKSDLLRQAVRQFIQSQSGLRLRFCAGEEPMQYVSEEPADVVPVMEFPSREDFDRYAETFAREPLGLTERCMYRFVVFHLEKENRSGILVALSHLISDAWTFGLMANQLDVAYRRLAGDPECVPVEGDYRDFIQSEDAYVEFAGAFPAGEGSRAGGCGADYRKAELACDRVDAWGAEGRRGVYAY